MSADAPSASEFVVKLEKMIQQEKHVPDQDYNINETGLNFKRLQEDPDSPAFDSQSSSLIKLNNGTILYLREVNRFLALVCILREDNFDKQGVIDYNFLCFREAIQQVFELRKAISSNIILNNHTEAITS
ncbi:ras-related GTP-binding protein C-like [Homalodisca vitripennis]|uniref:ras-related GTP-binding protein C-like n=1 Tax=Homalodisca vitripennis TaxID=197043 RepID=UPI001EEC9F2D|nr:ras-related GTP-binding protein C-like [Homalodisca vitripennis]